MNPKGDETLDARPEWARPVIVKIDSEELSELAGLDIAFTGSGGGTAHSDIIIGDAP